MNKTETIQLVRYRIPPPSSSWWNTVLMSKLQSLTTGIWIAPGLPVKPPDLHEYQDPQIQSFKQDELLDRFALEKLLSQNGHRRVRAFSGHQSPVWPDKEANEGVSWREEPVAGGSRTKKEKFKRKKRGSGAGGRRFTYKKKKKREKNRKRGGGRQLMYEILKKEKKKEEEQPVLGRSRTNPCFFPVYPESPPRPSPWPSLDSEAWYS